MIHNFKVTAELEQATNAEDETKLLITWFQSH
jgi:hypothetical protein